MRFEIGQIILDKNPKIRTVVQKKGEIKNEFRFYDVEYLAGESGDGALKTIHNEDGVKFHVDIQNMYWNSKL